MEFHQPEREGEERGERCEENWEGKYLLFLSVCWIIFVKMGKGKNVKLSHDR